MLHLKLKISILLTIIFTLVICGCASEDTARADSTNAKSEEIQENINAIRADSGVPPKDFGAEQTVVAASSELDEVEKILQSLTLEEKLGQMMIFGFTGTTVNDDITWMLANYHAGGIILFDRNMENGEQVKALTAGLEVAANEKVPLFFAIDEEGGRVARGKEFLIPPPSQEELGLSGDSTRAYNSANSIAQELKNLGFNLNFAPVADVGINDTRYFSDNANVVADFVLQAAKGYEDAGIFYCLKHFPGIGLGQIDSHQDISTITAAREVLETEDLLPFRKVISERDNSKFMVMISHYKYSAFDAENSATLSPVVVTEILRGELGFNGVVVTDDLGMGAVSKYHDEKSLGVQAVKAGVDIILSCHEYEKQKTLYDGIFEAVKSSEISEQRIDESVRRILKMKLGMLK